MEIQIGCLPLEMNLVAKIDIVLARGIESSLIGVLDART